MIRISTKSPQVVKDFFRDSSKWGEIKPRNDDIVIASCYKAGTTLTQQIVNLLLNGNKDFEAMRSLSPWVESAMYAPNAKIFEALTSPRFFKTHLHPQALPWLDTWKYIYLARDGRDVAFSLYNHYRLIENELEVIGKTGIIDNGPANFSDFWDQWLETGSPRWDFWENIDSWWKVRNQANVLLVHYNDLINNKPANVKKIAHFLGCKWNTSICDAVCKQSSLNYMRKLELMGKFGSPNKNKKKTGFINNGVNGRWADVLTNKQLQNFEAKMSQKLESECIAWLCNGGKID